MRRWARAGAGLMVAGLFLTLLARNIEWNEVRRVLAGATLPPLLLATIALGADMSARITRWWLMLRPVQPDLPWASCVRPFLGSLALNNTVPLRAGDVVRVFGFRRALRAPTAHLVGTLVLERMLDLLMLLAILLVGVLGTSGVFPRPFIVTAQVVGIVGVAVLLGMTLFPGPIASVLQRLVARIFARRSWLPAATAAVSQLT